MEHKCLHACTPENCSQVESFHWDPPGKSHFWFDKNRLGNWEKRHYITVLHKVFCSAMLKMDPQHIPDTLNWIFNLSTEPVIKFGHQIYQKSAATNQHQKHVVETVDFGAQNEKYWSTEHKYIWSTQIWQMHLNIRGKTCVFSYSQLVCCQRPNKLVLRPLGRMCAACDALPCTEESESNLKHWISVIHLTNFL